MIGIRRFEEKGDNPFANAKTLQVDSVDCSKLSEKVHTMRFDAFESVNMLRKDIEQVELV